MGLLSAQRRWAEKRKGTNETKQIQAMGEPGERALQLALADGWALDRTAPLIIEGTTWGTTYFLTRPRRRAT